VGPATESLRRINQPSPQTQTLARRIYGEQPDVSTIAANFDVDAAGESGGVFRSQEFPFSKIGSHALGTGAVAIEDRTLNNKCRVDQTDEGVDIQRSSEPRADFVWRRTNFIPSGPAIFHSTPFRIRLTARATPPLPAGARLGSPAANRRQRP